MNMHVLSFNIEQHIIHKKSVRNMSKDPKHEILVTFTGFFYLLIVNLASIDICMNTV